MPSSRSFASLVLSSSPRFKWRHCARRSLGRCRLLLSPGFSRLVRAISFKAKLNGQTVSFAVLCHHGEKSCNSYIFNTEKYESQTTYLFRRRDINRALRWSDLQVDTPELSDLTNELEITIGDSAFSLTVVSSTEEVEMFQNKVTMHRLGLDIRERPSTGTTSFKFDDAADRRLVALRISRWNSWIAWSHHSIVFYLVFLSMDISSPQSWAQINELWSAKSYLLCGLII